MMMIFLCVFCCSLFLSFRCVKKYLQQIIILVSVVNKYFVLKLNKSQQVKLPSTKTQNIIIININRIQWYKAKMCTIQSSQHNNNNSENKVSTDEFKYDYKKG